MSFKYRFILSFVLLQVFFISLIVSVNFVAISNLSNKLTEERIEASITFFDEIMKVPISIYDLATLDNLLLKTDDLEFVNSMIVLDNQNRLLSENYNFDYIELEDLIKIDYDFEYRINDELYEIKYRKIFENTTFLGSMYIIYDKSEDEQFINKNVDNTILIILIEIVISTFLSYLIGSVFTGKLTRLSKVAEEIGKGSKPNIPYLEEDDEIGTLSNSMSQMQIDIEDRNKKLQEFTKELNRQKNDLIEANRAKDDFLANMSHELKTPLNSINLISSILMKNKDGRFIQKDVKSLEIINNSGKELLNLINDVLDLSRLEAGEINTNFDKIDLYLALNEICDSFKLQADKKGLKLVLDYDKNIGFINSDGNKIRQILENLFSNALKFTNKGEIKISAKIEKEYLSILVKDDGIGISKDKLKHIFDRFKQIDASTTRKYGGTGLGLAISKDLAVLLGGELSVESELGKGSTFKLFIKNKINEKKV